MNIRSDHLAGGVFIALGLLVFILGWNLPFGQISSPGAGMLPKMLAGLMIACALIIMLSGRSSEPVSAIPWSDWTHAALIVIISSIATLLYARLGFLITMALLVFGLQTIVERKPVVTAAIYAILLTLFAYWLFAIALKAPIERGILWF
ncbi:MAG: tripartite tricarboxylate transporter TctB family protein [Pseudorhodoplanes sp.]|uniref:tripartite tricarboxylate transporter TctB family protein n=1 Tax=Pseudorhodoplanes sp. TaxID=1934341 RepID=UPI003D0DCC77